MAVLLTPLSASLCWALLVRSLEEERLWWGLRTSKAFLSADMAAGCEWASGLESWWGLLAVGGIGGGGKLHTSRQSESVM